MAEKKVTDKLRIAKKLLARHDEVATQLEVLQRRLAEHRRAELVAAVKSARQEFKAGRCRPATPAQIVKRIFA